METLQHILPGMAIMPNWHPLVVHYPIVLLTCYFLFELFGLVFHRIQWRRMASTLIVLGAVAAVIAVALGLRASETVLRTPEAHVIMLAHRLLGVVVLSMAAALAVWRLRPFETWSQRETGLHLLLAAVMLVALVKGADLGGLMVYGHGVAVGVGAK